MSRYFVEMYTDGHATRWNVIDRNMQEWVRRFAIRQEAEEYALGLNKLAAPTSPIPPLCTCPCSCDETPHDGSECLLHRTVTDWEDVENHVEAFHRAEIVRGPM